MMDCVFRELVGFDCIGCGITRSILALSKGALDESFTQFPALIPFAVLLLSLALLQFSKNKMMIILKNTSLISGSVLLLTKYIHNFI